MMQLLLVQVGNERTREIRDILVRANGDGFSVQSAANFVDALTMLGEQKLDAVLLDAGAPDADGNRRMVEFLRQTSNLPVVVLSDSEDPPLAVEEMRGGAEDCIVGEHISSGMLERTIRHAIERRQLRSEEARLIDTLQRIAVTLTSELHIEKLLRVIVEEAAACVGASCGSFLYRTRGGETEDVHTGDDCASFEELLRPGDLRDAVLQGSGPLRIHDLGDLSGETGLLRSFLATPVINRSGEVIGGIFFSHREPNHFSEREMRVVVGIAGWATVALENARLYGSKEDAIQARDRILAVVSHDLRNPVQTIVLSTELLRQRVTEPALKRGVIRILDSARYMTRLLDDLTDAARIEMGTLSIRCALHDPGQLVREACQVNEAHAQESGLQLQHRSAAELPRLQVDSDRILQVLGNLINNAIKFTPGGGLIEVHVEREDDSIRFVVDDSGQGIPPDDLPLIFKRFFKGSNALREGAGLGLAIARGIVEAHGGTMGAMNRGEGGASIYFSLPIAT